MESSEEKDMKDFNAVVEGIFPFQTEESYFRLLNLIVSENVGSLNDGKNRYVLFGKVDSFRYFEYSQRVESDDSDLEISVNFGSEGLLFDSFGFRRGVVYPNFVVLVTDVIEIPRTVCMRDGRIYVN